MTTVQTTFVNGINPFLAIKKRVGGVPKRPKLVEVEKIVIYKPAKKPRKPRLLESRVYLSKEAMEVINILRDSPNGVTCIELSKMLKKPYDTAFKLLTRLGSKCRAYQLITHTTEYEVSKRWHLSSLYTAHLH